MRLASAERIEKIAAEKRIRLSEETLRYDSAHGDTLVASASKRPPEDRSGDFHRQEVLEAIALAFHTHRSSLSRHTRKCLKIRSRLAMKFRKRPIEHIPPTDLVNIFTLWPGESIPQNFSYRDTAVYVVQYASAVQWLTRPTPAPYPFDSVSMSEIETEIQARKEALALEALSASFDPTYSPAVALADPPADAPEQIQITPRQIAPALPTAPADPPLTSWLNYFRYRK